MARLPKPKLRSSIIILVGLTLGGWLGSGDPWRRFHVHRISNDFVVTHLDPIKYHVTENGEWKHIYKYDPRENHLLVGYLDDPARFAAAHIALLNTNSIEQKRVELENRNTFMLNGLFIDHSQKPRTFDIEKSEDLAKYWNVKLGLNEP